MSSVEKNTKITFNLFLEPSLQNPACIYDTLQSERSMLDRI